MNKKYENQNMRWAIFGISVASLLIALIATYLIVRIIDGQWVSWQLPTIFVIAFFVIVPIGAMFTSIPDIKKEIEKNKETKD